MLTKNEIFKALKCAGFVQEEGERTNGSSKYFYNEEAPVVSITLVDHKNKNEFTTFNQVEAINAICLMAIIKSYYNGNLDKTSIKKYVSCLDKKIQEIIFNKLKKLDLGNAYAIMAIMPSAVKMTLSQFVADLNNDKVLNYFLSDVRRV